jgi:GH24 family phage-related lysozyme (muramidase)
MNKITIKVMQEIIDHEAIICETYKDSVGVWTWGVGVTTRSGHAVERYKDNPQSVARVIEIFEWLLREKYAPSVTAAFKGRDLTEAQFTAALSFHYNTGRIGKASWVKSWLAGNREQARQEFMNYRKPTEIIARRTKERDLFFDGKWSGTGKSTIYQVRKPSYQPSWSSAKRVDITADLVAALT